MRIGHIVGAATLAMTLSASQSFAGPVTLTCGPGQRAIVSQTFVRATPVTTARCVDAWRPRTYPVQYRYSRPHRSWGKTALTIAGGAGTGAGIGGIVKGKKGALIGATLGGGVASLYESTKRR